jgi:hypothetical protein
MCRSLQPVHSAPLSRDKHATGESPSGAEWLFDESPQRVHSAPPSRDKHATGEWMSGAECMFDESSACAGKGFSAQAGTATLLRWLR